MHNSTGDDLYQPGWFPIVELRFMRATDLVFCALVLGFGIFILLLILYEGKLLLGGISSRLLPLLSGSMLYPYTLAKEMTVYTYHVIQNISLTWYPVAALTLIPMAIDIQRSACVLYLLSYAAANTALLIYGVPNHEAEQEKTIQNIPPPPQDPKHTTRVLNSQFFTGMRITIQ
jgi:hypothetical protein